MPVFKVKLTRVVRQEATIIVEAKDSFIAKSEAMEKEATARWKNAETVTGAYAYEITKEK